MTRSINPSFVYFAVDFVLGVFFLMYSYEITSICIEIIKFQLLKITDFVWFYIRNGFYKEKDGKI